MPVARQLCGPALLLLSFGAAQKFSCSPAQDSAGAGLTTVLGPTLNQDFCTNTPSTSTVEGLMPYCEAFCGPGNVPFLVGVPSHGLSLPEVDRLCLGVGAGSTGGFARHDPKLMDDCKQWGEGTLNLIQTHLADLITALTNVTYAQLIFRGRVARKADEVKELLSSDQTIDTLQGQTRSTVFSKYLEILQAGLQDFSSNGQAPPSDTAGATDNMSSSARQELKDSLALLISAGSALQEALEVGLPALVNYTNECGQVLTSTGPAKEYLLDLCVHLADRCIEEQESSHVGCCCSVIPLAGSYSIAGEFSVPGSGSGIGSAPRRASSAEASSAEEQGTVDACIQAEVQIKELSAQQEEVLSSYSQGQQLLQGLRTAESNYDFYQLGCDDSRRLGPSGGEAEEEREEAIGSSGQPEEQGEAQEEQVQARRAQLASCSPQPSELDPSLKAAFWEHSESFCELMPPEEAGQPAMTVRGLTDICQEFCGPDAVAMLIGNNFIGFNQSSMDRACVAGDFVRSDRQQVQTCHTHVQTLQELSRIVAEFTASLMELANSKVVIQAAVYTLGQALAAAIKLKAADTLRNATVGKKVLALEKLMLEETAGLRDQNSPALQRYKDALLKVEERGQQVMAALNASAGAMEELATTCANMFTGTGEMGEYLLDVCSTTSQECMHTDVGRHAGCCCAYSPVMALGKQQLPSYEIPGLAAARFANDSRARTAGRRVTGEVQAQAQVYLVCGEAYKISQPHVQESQNMTLELGGERFLQARQRELQRQYPTARRFQSCESCDIRTGRTCRIFNCSSGLGATRCYNGECICAMAGHCVVEGVCRGSELKLEVAIASTTLQQSSDTTSTTALRGSASTATTTILRGNSTGNVSSTTLSKGNVADLPNTGTAGCGCRLQPLMAVWILAGFAFAATTS